MVDLHIRSIWKLKINSKYFFSFIMHTWNYFKWFLDKIVKPDKQLYDLLLSMVSAIPYP